MKVVVDGYNFIKGIFPQRSGLMEEFRNNLVKQLSIYKSCRKSIKEILVVFDGGLFSRSEREVHGGVTVIFSGRGRIADDWIVDYVERNSGCEIMVVTNDKKLTSRCHNFGADVIRIYDFNDFLHRALAEGSKDLSLKKDFLDDSIRKFEHDDVVAGVESLDLLMEQASIGLKDKDNNAEIDRQSRKGSSRRISKAKRKIGAKFNKL